MLQDGKKTFYSHKGSTYGGIVLEKEMLRGDKFRCIYDAFETYLKQQGFQEERRGGKECRSRWSPYH